MLRSLFLMTLLGLLGSQALRADTYTEQQGKEAWDRLKGQPLTENNFHRV